MFADNFEFSHNVISDVYHRPGTNIVFVHVAGVDFTMMTKPSTHENIRITDNLVIGVRQCGYKLSPGPCTLMTEAEEDAAN